jgi:hypothetical protein
MTVIGFLLLFWGFAWQTDVGEPQNIDGGELQGGPCLIPMGGAMLLIGMMWLLTGWRGFRKDRTNEDMQKCPHCGKMIESDLNFCYYCNKTFDEMEEEEKEVVRRPGKDEPSREGQRSVEGPPKKARPFSPDDR